MLVEASRRVRFRNGVASCAQSSSSAPTPGEVHRAIPAASSDGVISRQLPREPADVPTRTQLRTLFMHSAVPMVGFGEA